MVKHKTDRLYVPFIKDIVRDCSRNEFEEQANYWIERMVDARSATEDYLNLVGLFERDYGSDCVIRATQSIAFPSISPFPNYPRGKIFFDSVPQANVSDIRFTAERNGWTFKDSREVDVRRTLPGKQILPGHEIYCTDSKGRELTIHLGPTGFYLHGLNGDFRDRVAEFLGRLDSKELGVIIR